MLRSSVTNLSAIIKSTRNTQEKVVNKVAAKIQGTFIERIVKYLKLVSRDYKEVVVQLRQDVKEKKAKSYLIFSGMGFLGYCMTHNPSEQHFRARYIKCANDVGLVHPSTANPRAVNHLKSIQDSYNKGLIRHTSLMFFSVIWVDKFSNECKLYEANCSYTQLTYRQIFGNIIDVGFLNFWWVITRKMLDYDINY